MLVEYPVHSNQTFIGQSPICWTSGGNNVDTSSQRCLSFYATDSVIQCLLNPTVFSASPLPPPAMMMQQQRQLRNLPEFTSVTSFLGVDSATGATVLAPGSLVSLKYASDSLSMGLSDLVSWTLYIPMGTTVLLAAMVGLVALLVTAAYAGISVVRSWQSIAHPDSELTTVELQKLQLQSSGSSSYQSIPFDHQASTHKLQAAIHEHVRNGAVGTPHHHHSGNKHATFAFDTPAVVKSEHRGNRRQSRDDEQFVHLTASPTYRALRDDDRRPVQGRSSIGDDLEQGLSSETKPTGDEHDDTTTTTTSKTSRRSTGDSVHALHEDDGFAEELEVDIDEWDGSQQRRPKSQLLLQPGEELHTLETLERRLSAHISERGSPSARSDYMTEYGDESVTDLGDSFAFESPVEMRHNEVVLWMGSSQPMNSMMQLSLVIAFACTVSIPLALSIAPTIAVATDVINTVFSYLFAAFAVALSCLAAIMARGKKAHYMLTNQRWITVSRKYAPCTQHHRLIHCNPLTLSLSLSHRYWPFPWSSRWLQDDIVAHLTLDRRGVNLSYWVLVESYSGNVIVAPDSHEVFHVTVPSIEAASLKDTVQHYAT